MRNIALLFSLVLFLFFACKSTEEKKDKASVETTTSTVPKALVKDTLLIAEVDTIVAAIFEQLYAGVQPSEMDMEFEGKTEILSYYDLPDGLARLDAKSAPEGYERYATIFMKDDEPILFRFREWDRVNPSAMGAGEIFAYLKNGEIFYAQERSMPLAPGQGPNALRDKGYVDTQRTQKELTDLMNTYYPSMKKAWDKREK